MEAIGKQYSADNQSDPSGFLSKARLHQSRFRAEVLNLPFEKYGNYLTKKDGEEGFNFYNGFNIFQSVKQYRKYNKPLYSNMLRSEHIPFNFFIPFNSDLHYCKNVFTELLKSDIKIINRIEIEYAPQPKGKYLNDGTSFDTYIEYTMNDSTKGIIGIEVKYTEREYRLEKNSKQEIDVLDKSSRYYTISNECKIYKEEALKVLPSDKFRQIWRNHILGESILLADSDKFKHFTSVTIFPEGNIHFVNTSNDYFNLLIDNCNSFLPVTYEDFFSACDKHCPDDKYKEWLNYLVRRYIVKA